jgi:hypothetical protein
MDQAELLNLDERIREATAKLAERAHLMSLRAPVAAQHVEADGICQEYMVRIDKERDDVLRAKQGGVRAFLVGLVNDRAQRISKEEQDVAAAQARLAEAAAYRDRLAAELKRIDARVAELATAGTELEDARRAKELLLTDLDPKLGAQLTRVADEIAAAHATIREIDEALRAGETALSVFMGVNEMLESARIMSAADMARGGMGTDIMKRELVADANRMVVGTAQAELMVFNRELADVGRSLKISFPDLNIGRGFFDVALDSFWFGDYPVNQRIGMANSVMGDASERIRMQLIDLRTQRAILVARVDTLTRDRIFALDPQRKPE